MPKFLPVVILASALAIAGAAVAQGLSRVDIGARAPDFHLTGSDGKTHSLKAYRGRVVVLEWTSPACPYTAQKYRDGVIQGLQANARRQGVTWISINTSAKGRPGYLTAAGAKARIAATKASPTAFLLDNGGKVGRMYGAKTTPSFFIVGKDGRLAYQGAIDDDAYARGEATHNYVSEALSDIGAGRPVATPETRPYGCAVEY